MTKTQHESKIGSCTASETNQNMRKVKKAWMTKSSFDENAKDVKKTSSLPSRQEFSSTLAPMLTELNAS